LSAKILPLPFQQTIAKPISVSGKGLHSGVPCTVTLHPAEPNSGIVFKRTDRDAVIPADCDLVVDVRRGTTLELDGVRVSTVEHLMAALAGCEIDNAVIELSTQEIPILDGSAYPFVQLIRQAGIAEQKEKRSYYHLDETIRYYDEEKDTEYLAVPYANFSITTLIDFNSEVIGKQFAELKDMRDFVAELSSSRTFCFLHEVEQLYRHGLIKGGDLSNAIVIAEKQISSESARTIADIFQQDIKAVPQRGIVNNIQLRYPNEMARHKLLDMVGDLALTGIPLKAKIFASRPGHASNVAFAQLLKKKIAERRKIREAPKPEDFRLPVYELNEIKKILPHREPFLFLDKILDITETTVTGLKNVTANEDFFKGHFPCNPVMPGVLQIEAMAQTGGILALKHFENPSEYITYFSRIENAKFYHPVVPGDSMVIKMSMNHPIKLGVVAMHGIIYVRDQIVCEADLTAKITKR
jgi:UDP-3-O-[3-hydroxymyristoyl] N-acetylglucosamine deacetylase/3-hydroxyacyl-[acyl-carrier-protein] dehydratase